MGCGCPGSSDKYLAVFNLDDQAAVEVSVLTSELGLKKKCAVRDLWHEKDLGIIKNSFSPMIPSHGAGLYRIAPAL